MQDILTHDVTIDNCMQFQSPEDVLHLGEVCVIFSRWDDIKRWRERMRNAFIESQHQAIAAFSRKELKFAIIYSARTRRSTGFVSALCASSEHHIHEALRNTTDPALNTYWSSTPGKPTESQTLVYYARQRDTVFKQITLIPYSHHYFFDDVTRTFMWGYMVVQLYRGGTLPVGIEAEEAAASLEMRGAEKVYEEMVVGSVCALPGCVLADWMIVTLHNRLLEEYPRQGWYFCVERVDIEGALIPHSKVDWGKLDDSRPRPRDSMKHVSRLLAQRYDLFDTIVDADNGHIIRLEGDVDDVRSEAGIENVFEAGDAENDVRMG
eukprot:GEMP01018656.1.p1 GENE.GEMP01018656.1~~GEMP01018656.1.p1  ORF type:complete len:345 (+),score=71.42 GEMP01018656.1:70-1035(+)